MGARDAELAVVMDYKVALDEAFNDQVGHLFQVLCASLAQGDEAALAHYALGAERALRAYREAEKCHT